MEETLAEYLFRVWLAVDMQLEITIRPHPNPLPQEREPSLTARITITPLRSLNAVSL